MNQTNFHTRKTDLAWDQLYTRLEKDGLLSGIPVNNPSSGRRIQAVSWAAVIAVLCVSLVTLYYVTLPGENTLSLLTAQNNEDATTLVTTLEDGSIVYLGENAALHYPAHFEEDKRQVALEGNAQFEISGNKERPFYIETKEVEIEVLGTTFQIKNELNNPFELMVTKGEVKVTAKDNKESSLVKAGEKVQLLPDGLLVSFMDNYELIKEEHSRYIRFKDEKLGDVLHVLNKNITGTPLSVEASLSNKIFTVTFANDTSPDDIAEVICAGLNLRYVKENGKITLMD